MANRKEKDKKKKNPNGRPLKYTTEFIENEADELEKWINRPDSPWFEDFANQRGYSPDYLSEWAKDNEKFFGVYRRAKALQKSTLIKGGLTNQFNSNFVKFVMANTCGWSDKAETKINADLKDILSFALNEIEGRTKNLVKESDLE